MQFPQPSTKRQLDIQIQRYLTMIWSDKLNSFLLFVQAPFIGWCIGNLALASDLDRDTLLGTLVLSIIWCGCLNSCREIVKELPSLKREVRWGVSITAYLLSKVLTLSCLVILQTSLILLISNHYFNLYGSIFSYFLPLFFTGIIATCWGLFLSCIVSQSDRALALVPLFIIPQLLFSSLLLQSTEKGTLIYYLQQFTVSYPSQEVLNFILDPKTDHSWKDLLFFLFLLLLSGVFTLFICQGILKYKTK